MRIDFRNADIDKLVALWNTYYPDQFQVDSQIFRQNTVESPTFDWGASAIEVCDDEIWGFVAIKQSPNPKLYAGPNSDTSHVSALAYTEPEVGIDLLHGAKQLLKNRGVHQLLYGMDSRHFFPGCPDDAAKLCTFLMVEGFEKSGGHFDLERDLADYVNPVRPLGGIQFREATEGDMTSVKQFFAAEFPDRWRYDVMAKISAEGIGNTLYGAFDGSRMIGFALLQDWRHKMPIGGAVWRCSLGERWGSLGPIGVAKSERGRGVGDALLGEALSNLQHRGVRRCIIDWTTLEDYYGKHGFEITRRYKRASLRLAD